MRGEGGEKVKLDFSKMNAAIKREAQKAVEKKMYEVSCKNCHAKVLVPTGKSACPHCGKEIDLIPNIH